MSAWDDRFKNHPVHNELADALTQTRKLKLPRGAVELAEARQRLERALGHVAAVLNAADPELTIPAVLDGIHGQIAPLLAQLEYADDSEEATYLDSANAHADSMLQSAAGITPRLAAPDDVASVQESATKFRQSAGQLTRQVREDAEALAGDIDGLKTRTSDLTADIEAQKGRIDQAISDAQQQFSEEQSARATAFEASRDELKDDAQETLVRLAKMEEDAKRHLDVIGVVGMAAGYQQVADKEEEAANTWRLVAVGTAGLAIALNVVLIASIAFGWLDEDFDWDRQVPRVLLTLSLFGVASYAGIESSRHRRRQEANRQIEKELTSLEPYLALFEDDEKKRIKEAKFDFFFQGRPNVSTDGRDGNPQPP
jgi:hypothetical protein